MAQFIKAVVRQLSPRNPVYYRNISLLGSSYNKDVMKPPPLAIAPDILLQNLKYAKTVGSVLDMVGSHQKIMNTKHILQALRTVFALQKQGDADMSMKQVLKHPYFESLCRSLKTKAGAIEVNETVEALKIVFYLGVRPDSTIVQVLLQLVKHNLNSLSLHHIIFLDFLLTTTTKTTTPLIEALKMALPLVFEIHCQKKMDRENIGHLSDYLYFASKHNLNENCIEDITFAILHCKEPLDQKTAKSIIWSITHLPSYEFVESVFKKALDTFRLHLDETPFVEIETTLSKVLQKVTRKNFYYDQTFVDDCINSAIDKDAGYTESIHLARKLCKVGHHNRYILDHIATKIYEYPNLILKGDPLETYILANAMSLTEDKPVQWGSIKEVLEMSENLIHSRRKEISWLKFATSLSFLGIFRRDVLELAFREDYLIQTFNKKFKRDLISYLALCQAIKLHKPDLISLIPETIKPENVIREIHKPTEFPLESSLYMAFGGEKYVGTNFLSKAGSLVDHIIVFRTGGFPVALNLEEVEFIEDVSVTIDQQIVAVIGLNESDLTINTRNMKSTTSMRIRSLEAEGHSVVPIDLEMWNSLPDFEKIPYLVQAIKAKSAISFTASADIG